MYRLIIMVGFLTFLLASCDLSNGPTEEAVIEVHDIAMAKMGDIHLAKKKLRAISEGTEDKEMKDKISSTLLALKKADDGMMQWMEDWSVPKDKNEQSAYFESEMIKITQVKVDILASLDDASKIIKTSNEQ